MTSFKDFSNHKLSKILIGILAGSIILIVTLLIPNLNSMSNPHNNSLNENIISGSFDESKLKSEEEWKKILSPEQFHILREKGTDRAFTKDMTNSKVKGAYISVGCDQPVFRSETKFDSGTGWPSFYAPIDINSLVLREDYELGYRRVEVMDRCGGHLGHVFDDGPKPTGKRYCVNATALKFIPD